MTNYDLVLYHANCWDGFCAAWIAHRFLPSAEYMPVQYGQEPPDVTGREVLIVDFSFKRAVLLGMKAKAKSLFVLDHHKTAQADLEGLDFCRFDMNKSGARLTKEYFNDLESWLVDYTEDRDLWLWRLPRSKEINSGLRSYPLDFKVWDELVCISGIVERLYTEGAAILRAEAMVVASSIQYAVDAEIKGHKVRVVNATTLISEIAGALAENNPFGVSYFVKSNGVAQISLRSRKGGVDVSEIAKYYGGGGHAGAAGFELPVKEAMELFYDSL